jgi:hypothetical protein
VYFTAASPESKAARTNGDAPFIRPRVVVAGRVCQKWIWPL